MRFSIVVLFAMAAAPETPMWPKGAHLTVGTWQLVFAAPAAGEAELLKRAGRFGLSLRWPAITSKGIVTYRIFRDGRLIATVAHDVLEFTEETKGTPQYDVEACQPKNRCSARLSVLGRHDVELDALEGGVTGGEARARAAPLPAREDPARATWLTALNGWTRKRMDQAAASSPPVEPGATRVKLTVRRDGTFAEVSVLGASEAPGREAAARRLFEGARGPSFPPEFLEEQTIAYVKVVFPE